MNFLITGGTGFIGNHLTNHLIEKGHHVFVVTRSPEKAENTAQKTYISYDTNPAELPDIYGVVNLAGESLFGYWTAEKKKKIRESRINATKQILELVSRLKAKPSVFINGSAVGYYGASSDIIFTEKTVEPGKGFLSSVVVEWEKEASAAEKLGIRTIYARFGIVLGKKEGSLPLMALPVKLGIGGKIGDGEQWISWVHIYDVVRLLSFCLFQKEIAGPVNVTAPEPKQNKAFYQDMAEVYSRPLWLHMPRLFIRLTMGEMAELITEGQFVYPQKAKDSGFTFEYPKLKAALKALI